MTDHAYAGRMIDRDRVSRKIAALFARAEDGASTPDEVAVAMRAAHRLMADFDLTRDEATLRAEAVGQRETGFAREWRDYAGMLAAQIRRLTDCQVNGEAYRDACVIRFIGMRVDVEYASWLLRTAMRALASGWSAWAASPGHARLLADGAAAAAIERQWKLGFVLDVIERIKVLAAERAEGGTALAPLKEKLVGAAMGGAAVTSVRTDQLAIRADLNQAFRSGAGEGAKVGLRHEIG